jgi:hypothetical protein
MIAVKFIVLLLILWCLRELIIAFFVKRHTKELSYNLLVDRTQGKFAKARNTLMRLALMRKIDADSATFRSLYFLLTGFMRRPDAYPQINAALRKTFLLEGSSIDFSVVEAESNEWNSDIKQVVALTAEALNDIIINYAQFTETRRGFLRSKHIFHFDKRKDPVLEDIRETQRRMRELSTVR